MTSPSSETGKDADRANRLIHETSPYLLQHARNPVDWYPWGPEAFEAARRQGRPIFLSIGYSTCYWCHVMERESFEDASIAEVMNEHFVSIKVDREVRPDVDEIYMAATQIMNQGRGGWPMSVFLEPETLQPFFAGTYYPPQGFRALLERVAEVWRDDRQVIRRQSEELARLVRQQLSLASWAEPLGAEHVDAAVDLLMRMYDETHGGFGRGDNKFPTPPFLELLAGAAWEREQVRQALLHTLDRMAAGGVYDQIGGGFHRYSTDERWLVPHFEKMLYDNGQLASVYAEAHARSGDRFYAGIVRGTLDYVLREMTAPQGGFYSAQDAEVEGREGASYVWTAEEVRAALSAAGLGDDTEFALQVYGLDRGTNFRDPHHPEAGARNVLHLAATPDRLAGQLDLEPQAFRRRLDRVDEALLAARDRRRQPETDDKILTAWNGLMIAGMADGARVLEEPRYLDAARAAAEFALETLRSGDGGLMRAWRGGKADVAGFLEDYAMMIRGLIALHRAGGGPRWLEAAEELAAQVEARFRDPEGGAFFDVEAGETELFVRSRSTYDGAAPCGNSVMLNNLLDLHELTGRSDYLDGAVTALRALSPAVARNPSSTALSTLALHRILQRDPELVAWGRSGDEQGEPVAVGVDTETVALSTKEAGALAIVLDVAEGYHINAHDPGDETLVGLRVRLAGAEGLVVHPDYPEGEPYRGGILIHRGRVRVPVRVQQTGPVKGEPKLVVTWQTCTDKLCLAPKTATIPVELAPAESR